MSTNRFQSFALDPSEDPTPSVITAALANLPKQERDATIVFYQKWRSLTKDSRAAFAKIAWPALWDSNFANPVTVPEKPFGTRSRESNHAESSLRCPIVHDDEPSWWYDCDRNDIA
jgi:hypothetical protein